MSESVSDGALARAKEDFRIFLYLVWKHLGLPEPTRAQYEIANYLQYGPRRKCIMGFRGVGKSWITSAYVIWLLWNDIELKVLVVSASKDRSDSFSIFTKRLLSEIPWLRHLRPDPRAGDRDSNVAFDIRGCRPAHAPSVKSVGITGQITGSRADFIIGDDVEVVNNSETATQRDKLLSRVSELGGAVLTPEAQDESGKRGGVTFLGTPQVEDSLYNHIEERGYEVRIWPARYPDDLGKYGERLAEGVLSRMSSGEAQSGDPVDPERFDNIELAQREVEYGSVGFALQFQLDTSLSDEDKYPLKLKDLIVMDVDVDVAPDKIVWGDSTENTIEHLPRCGLTDDHFNSPVFVAKTFTPFTGSIMYIDPSGRGRDQTSYAVVKMLNGMLFVRRWNALDGGYEPVNLTKLATVAKEERVNEVIVEDNFGDGMWAQLFRPVLAKVYVTPNGQGCVVSDDHVSGQKERRILESVEPVMSSHRLIMDKTVVTDALRDKRAIKDPDAALKQGFYQMTRLSHERGCLKYDDWMDSLAGAVRYWKERMSQDVDKQAKLRSEERLDKELRKFMESFDKRSTSASRYHDRL